jgi:hypothetical protein
MGLGVVVRAGPPGAGDTEAGLTLVLAPPAGDGGRRLETRPAEVEAPAVPLLAGGPTMSRLRGTGGTDPNGTAEEIWVGAFMRRPR